MVTQDNLIELDKASPVPQRPGFNKSRRYPSKKQLQAQFHLPAGEAAKVLGISVSKLYKTCKKHSIKGWPTRKPKNIVTKFFNYVVESGTLVQSKGEVIPPKEVFTSPAASCEAQTMNKVNQPASASPIANDRSVYPNSIVQNSQFFSKRPVSQMPPPHVPKNWTSPMMNSSFAHPCRKNNCYEQNYYNQNGYVLPAYQQPLPQQPQHCFVPQEMPFYNQPMQQTPPKHCRYEEPEEVRLPSFGELLESVCAYEISHPKVPKQDSFCEYDCLLLNDTRSIHF